MMTEFKPPMPMGTNHSFGGDEHRPFNIEHRREENNLKPKEITQVL
jgi:hypothetical protein